MDQYSREFIAEKARLSPEDLGVVRAARRSHNQLGLAYQIAFIRLTGRAPGPATFRASGRPWAEESLLPSDPRARPRLQDRVHPRLPEPAGASHADPTRAPQGRTATRPRPVRPLRPTGPTGSARLRTPNRRGELPASHPRSYHLYIRTRSLADQGVIEDVLAVENDVVPFDRAAVLEQGVPGKWETARAVGSM